MTIPLLIADSVETTSFYMVFVNVNMISTVDQSSIRVLPGNIREFDDYIMLAKPKVVGNQLLQILVFHDKVECDENKYHSVRLKSETLDGVVLADTEVDDPWHVYIPTDPQYAAREFACSGKLRTPSYNLPFSDFYKVKSFYFTLLEDMDKKGQK